MTTSSDAEKSTILETATLGGGCFWCIEAVFQRLHGVRRVFSGYAGGQTSDPTYSEICTGTTGHAEVIQIEFEPTIISFGEILDLFWASHDPTTLNRQGADVGTQYRSIILTHNDLQAALANASRDRAGTRFKDPIVTELASLDTFTPAEDTHQDYFSRNPAAGYCTVVIRPKIEALERGGVLPGESRDQGPPSG